MKLRPFTHDDWRLYLNCEDPEPMMADEEAVVLLERFTFGCVIIVDGCNVVIDAYCDDHPALKPDELVTIMKDCQSKEKAVKTAESIPTPVISADWLLMNGFYTV